MDLSLEIQNLQFIFVCVVVISLSMYEIFGFIHLYCIFNVEF